MTRDLTTRPRIIVAATLGLTVFIAACSSSDGGGGGFPFGASFNSAFTASPNAQPVNAQSVNFAAVSKTAQPFNP